MAPLNQERNKSGLINYLNAEEHKNPILDTWISVSVSQAHGLDFFDFLNILGGLFQRN